MPEKKPISENIISRALRGLRYAFTGESPTEAWMGPLDPVEPVVPADGPLADSVRGRQFDFPAGYNLRTRPRADEAISFEQLRALVDNCDVLRLVIETRKDQMAKLKFSVRPIDPDIDPDDRCREVETFFKLPDGEHDFHTWQRMVLDDLFILDAVCVYPWLNNDGTPYRFDLIDPATIKRIINDAGRTPLPPDPAYQQVLKGIPVANYTADELVYASRNRRTNRVYGLSPVEQIVMTVNMAIRRAVYQLQFYTEGATPDLLFSVPPEWNPDQIKQFQDWWDMLLSGNTAQRHKGLFIPHGVTPINTREGTLKDDFDEWLARIVCYAFSVPPTPFIRQMNRATAETSQEAALSEGLTPIMAWIKGLLDTLIWKYFGYTDLELVWDQEKAVDPGQQATINSTYVKTGIMTINEVRQSIGMDPIDGGDDPVIVTGSGAIRLSDALQQSAQQPEQQPEQQPIQKPEQSIPESPEKFVKVGIKKKSIEPIDRDRLVPLEQKLADVVGAFLSEMVSGITDQLSAILGKIGKDDQAKKPPADQIDFSDWKSISVKVVPLLEAAAAQGSQDAVIQIAAPLSDSVTLMINEQAVQWAKNRAAEWVGMKWDGDKLIPNPNAQWQITESTREMIREKVAQAEQEGWSNQDLAKALREDYAFSPERAMTIARTETAMADTAGNMIGWEQSGVVHRKEWLTAPDCCPICAALDHEIVGFGDGFSDGTFAPPRHPNCRCTLLPVVDDPALED